MLLLGTPEKKNDSGGKQKPRPLFTAPDADERDAMASWYDSPGTMKLGAGSDKVGDVPLFLEPPCICYWFVACSGKPALCSLQSARVRPATLPHRRQPCEHLCLSLPHISLHLPSVCAPPLSWLATGRLARV